jgi:hypothetical protein
MKKQSVKSLKKKADTLFSEYVRRRDSDKYGFGRCITCAVRKPWRELQNGHFVKRSVNLLRFDEENCNAQCAGCNVFKYGEQYLYSKAIDDKYGAGTAEKLMAQRFTPHKFTIEELNQIIEDTKELILWNEQDRKNAH